MIKNQGIHYEGAKDDNIRIYDAKGKLQRKIIFSLKDKIAVFDFLEDETLLILMESSNYFLVDPSKGTIKE